MEPLGGLAQSSLGELNPGRNLINLDVSSGFGFRRNVDMKVLTRISIAV
jgi:hypothetical protein